MKIQKYLPILGVLLLLSFVSMAFVNQADRPTDVHTSNSEFAKASLMPADGQEIYETYCVSCHMMNGEGVPGAFPPIAESEYVTGDKGQLIRMVLNGLMGEITVKGVTYSGMMPPWKDAIKDDGDMAALLTYIRSNFGNEASAITAEEVAKVRAKVSGNAPWTMEELSKEANQGIPGGD